ncbi:hypothetical protein ACHQM5_008696 [Ranunculus cassubicifolius]
MEINEIENIFDSLNLNPQLFINEALNSVDDIVFEGFEFYEKEALKRFGGISEENDDNLRKGVASIHYMIQAALDKRLGMWEAYCLRHCFRVPEGLSLPKDNMSGDSLMELDALADKDMDNELESLREELSVEQKECDKLQREFYAIRKQSIHYRHVESVKEALKQFDPTNLQNMFQEMAKAAAKLRENMENVKNKVSSETEKMDDSMYIKGLSDADHRTLQDHLADL